MLVWSFSAFDPNRLPAPPAEFESEWSLSYRMLFPGAGPASMTR